MQHILDATMAGDTATGDFASLEIPDHYRAATVHTDEVDMFEGIPTKEKDPAGRSTSRTWRCPSSARARRWSR